MAESVDGGVPIPTDLATDLRTVCFGSAAAPPTRPEWTKTSFNFVAPNEKNPYGLRCPRNACRGLIAVVQGFLVKNFLFDRRARSSLSTPEDLLRPSHQRQIDSLILAMSEILKQIAEKEPIMVVLPSEEIFVAHSVTFFHDSVTEKLYVFQMQRPDDVQFFLQKHISHFIGESGPGCMLFLYSAVLTRTISKVKTDLDNSLQYLTGTFEEGSLNVVTLLLTGRATPHLHNGVIHVGDEDNYALPQYGILNRCPVGLLIYENEKRVEAQKQPGSRLKTPNLPIWIGSCMGYFGVLFNTNADLLRNYHAESRFDLFYYSMAGTQVSMTIDNSTYHDQAAGMLLRAPSGSEGFSTSRRNSDVDDKDESSSSPLQKLIHTKWQESSVKFHDDPQIMSTLFCPF